MCLCLRVCVSSFLFCFARLCVDFLIFHCFWKFLLFLFLGFCIQCLCVSVVLCLCFLGFSALWVLRFSAPLYACVRVLVKRFKLYPLRCSAPLYACACACVCFCLLLEQTGSKSIRTAMVAIMFVALPQESAHVAVQDSA